MKTLAFAMVMLWGGCAVIDALVLHDDAQFPATFTWHASATVLWLVVFIVCWIVERRKR